MAIVNKYSVIYPDPDTQPQAPIPAKYKRGPVKTSMPSVAITNGDSATSTFHLVKLPSTCVLHNSSKVYHQAIAGVTTAHIGTEDDPDALLASSNISTGSAKSLITDTNAFSQDRELWELLGMAEDPGGEIALILTINADATATGKVLVKFDFTE